MRYRLLPWWFRSGSNLTYPCPLLFRLGFNNKYFWRNIRNMWMEKKSINSKLVLCIWCTEQGCIDIFKAFNSFCPLESHISKMYSLFGNSDLSLWWHCWIVYFNNCYDVPLFFFFVFVRCHYISLSFLPPAFFFFPLFFLRCCDA